jgi:hypothetical protein
MEFGITVLVVKKKITHLLMVKYENVKGKTENRRIRLQDKAVNTICYWQLNHKCTYTINFIS